MSTVLPDLAQTQAARTAAATQVTTARLRFINAFGTDREDEAYRQLRAATTHRLQAEVEDAEALAAHARANRAARDHSEQP